MLGQTNTNTCRMSELNNQNINVEHLLKKLLINMILIKDILTFLHKDDNIHKREALKR